MNNFFRSRRGAITLVVVIAFFLRLYAAFELPLDFDEPVYLQAAFDYAGSFRAGDLQAIIDYPEHPEHPPLVKLLYSLTMLPFERSMGWSDTFIFSRLVSVIFGTLAVWVLAVVDPLAGFLLALQTYGVKYTSQAYLEALPLFTSLAALFALRHSKVGRDRWFWLSAAALGVTMAGKYSYFPIVFVILYVYFVERKYSWKGLLPYFGLAALTFLVLDPYLWRDPVQRLYSSVFFHTQYAQGTHVQQVGYPWYQPLIWLSKSMPYEWHPAVFFYNPLEGLFSVDGIIFMLAAVGLAVRWREQRYVLVWIIAGMLSLLLWPTKWPQYTLVVIPAFCLAASAGFKYLFSYIRHLEDYYGWVSSMIPMPGKVVWIAVALFVGFFGVFTVVSGINMYQGRQGWSHVMKGQSELPSNSINALAAMPEGEVAVGTDKGLAIWSPVSATISDTWQVLDTSNSGLLDNEILSLLAGSDGALWIGTDAGPARYDGHAWQTFDAQSLGLPSARTFDLLEDSLGEVWVATDAGAAVYDGREWTSFTPDNSGLANSLVLSAAALPGPGGEQIYFGTGDGLSRFDPASGEWETIQPERFNARNGGISDLLVDSQKRLWVATFGSGVHRWDGTGWAHYTLANSDLPTNRIDSLFEDGQGHYWIAASFPERPGGLLARFDGKEWQTYEFRYSGYSGGSTVAIAQDALGRLWFGTQSMGLDIFDPTEK